MIARSMPGRRSRLRRYDRQGGFTLIELLVAIGVIVVLVGLSFPAIGAVRRRSQVRETDALLQRVKLALSTYAQDFGDYPPSAPKRVGLKGNGQNDGVELLLRALSTKAKSGPYLQLEDRQMGNTDGDRLTNDNDPFKSTFLNRELLEILDSWQNPVLYLHNADYDKGGAATLIVGEQTQATQVPAGKSQQTGQYLGLTTFQLWSAGPDGKASELRAQTRTTITHFRFDVGGPAATGDTSTPPSPTSPVPAPADDDDDEPEPPFDVTGALNYVMTVDGGEVVQGRYGQGVLFERPGAWASIEDRPALSPAEGIFVELSVYLGVLSDTLRAKTGDGPSDKERAKAGLAGDPARVPSPRIVDWRKRSSDSPPLFHLARKGKAWSIAVTADYEVEVALTGPPATGGQDVTFISRTAPDTLKPDRWHRVALAFDGTRCRVVVDGIPRVHVGLPGNDALPGRLVRDLAPLSLSDPDPEAGFYGVIDELKIAAILDSQRVEIPREVLVICPDDAVGFDLLGQLDTGRHAEPVVIYLTDDERAYALVDPPATTGTGATQTRADQERLRLATGASRYSRFVKGLNGLDPLRWKAVVVERTGLVR